MIQSRHASRAQCTQRILHVERIDRTIAAMLNFADAAISTHSPHVNVTRVQSQLRKAEERERKRHTELMEHAHNRLQQFEANAQSTNTRNSIIARVNASSNDCETI